jgi:lysophospholipase L1-like esterase
MRAAPLVRRGAVSARLGLAALALALALLAAEGAARLLGVEPVYGRFIALGDTPTRTVGDVVLWQDAAPRAGAADLARAAAAPDAYTIVGLGDSIMYGVGQSKEATYLEQARRRLAADGAPRFEMLNLAVPGYNTLQEDAVHRELSATVQPDLVLLHYWSDDARLYRVVGGYVVDFGDMSADGRLVVRALPVPAAINDYLLVHSRLYQLLTQAVIAYDRRATPADWRRVEEPLIALSDRVRDGGGRLVVLASPDLGGEAVRANNDLPALRRLGAAHHFEVVDLAEWLPGAAAADVRMDACHLNAEGHRRIGERLARYLRERDLR